MTPGVAFGLGLLAGSFANACIHRWPEGRSVVSPRSRCPRCASPIAWYDNVPLLSYLMLRGRCRACERPVSLRYPFVEALNACAYALLATQIGPGPAFWKAATLATILSILFFTDLARLVLPDEATLPGLAIGIGFSLIVPMPPGPAGIAWAVAGVAPPSWAASLTESLVAAAVFGGLLLLLAETFYRLRGVDGLGRGDVKLIAMLGAFLGASMTLLVLLAASLVATVGGIAGVVAGGKGWRDPLPFGSYICGAAFAALFAGDAILNRYWEFVLG